MKRISKVIIAGIIMSMLLSVTVTAQTTKDNGCYIATSECPDGYWDYVEENINDFVNAVEGSENYTRLTVGQPFAFSGNTSGMYLFPIMDGTEIVYVFRVVPAETGYEGIISEIYADELNTLGGYTTLNNPMNIYCDGDSVIAAIGDKECVIWENIGAEAGKKISVSNNRSANVVDITDNSSITVTPVNTRATVDYIPLNITEYQGTTNWSTAYCLATVIRTQTSATVTAANCMQKALGSGYSGATEFPWSKVKIVAMEYGMSPTLLTSVTSNTILKREMSEGSPVLQRMIHEESYITVVLRGFNGVNNKWSIWNPICTSYEYYNVGGSYIDPMGDAYTAIAHAYDFD